MDLSSEVGKGSAFWFTADFLYASETPDGLTDRQQQLIDLVTAKNVLLVDSSNSCRRAMGDALRTWKFNYGEAKSTDDALKLLADSTTASLPLDLVIINGTPSDPTHKDDVY